MPEIKRVLNVSRDEKLSIVDFLYGIGCSWVYRHNAQYHLPIELENQIKDKNDFNQALIVAREQVAIATKLKSSNQAALQGNIVILKDRIKSLNRLIHESQKKQNQQQKQGDLVNQFLADTNDWINNRSRITLANFYRIHDKLRFLNLTPLDGYFAYTGEFTHQAMQYLVYVRLDDDFLDKHCCNHRTSFYLELACGEMLLTLGYPDTEKVGRIADARLHAYAQIAKFITATSQKD